MKEGIIPNISDLAEQMFAIGSVTVEVEKPRTVEDPRGRVTLTTSRENNGACTILVETEANNGLEKIPLISASGPTPGDSLHVLFVGRSGLRREVFSSLQNKVVKET